MISLLAFILNVGNFPRAFQQTDAGKVRKAMAKMMKAFEPELAKTMVAEREVVERIETRLRSWQGHATIIAGRHGSGKSVALEEALRGMQGVYVHTVEDKDWKKSLYKDLGLDNLGMLKVALRLEPGVNPHPRIGHSSNNEGRRDVGDFGCFVFDSLGCRHGYGFHLRQDSVVGQFAGTRRDPKTQPPCFAVLR